MDPSESPRHLCDTNTFQPRVTASVRASGWSEGSGRHLTLQVEHQQLPARVLVGPVAEGQHGLLQQVGGVDLLAVVVVELAELAGYALLDGEPLAGRVAVEQEHLQEPEDGGGGGSAASSPRREIN